MKACTQIPYEFSTMYEFKIVIVSRKNNNIHNNYFIVNY